MDSLGPTLNFLLAAFASFVRSLHSGEIDIDIMEHVNVTTTCPAPALITSAHVGTLQWRD